MSRILLAAFIAVASPAFAQHVEVTVRPDKPVYLEGEPVHLVVEVKNISEYPIGYNDGGTLLLEVRGRTPYDWRQRCRESYGEGTISVSGVSHPPTFFTRPDQNLSLPSSRLQARTRPSRDSRLGHHAGRMVAGI